MHYYSRSLLVSVSSHCTSGSQTAAQSIKSKVPFPLLFVLWAHSLCPCSGLWSASGMWSELGCIFLLPNIFALEANTFPAGSSLKTSLVGAFHHLIYSLLHSLLKHLYLAHQLAALVLQEGVILFSSELWCPTKEALLGQGQPFQLQS